MRMNKHIHAAFKQDCDSHTWESITKQAFVQHHKQ